MYQDEQKLDKDLYTIAVAKYRKLHPELELSTIFSNVWIESNDYRMKVIILAEAIKKGILVEKTEQYKEVFLLNNDDY